MTTASSRFSWFHDLAWYANGLGPRPALAPKPAPKSFVLDMERFRAWSHWIDGGKKTPRPDVWKTVPEWAWDLRKAIVKHRGITTGIVGKLPIRPAVAIDFVPALWVSDGSGKPIDDQVDTLLGDLRAMRAEGCFFQCSGTGWINAFKRVHDAYFDAQFWTSCSQIDLGTFEQLVKDHTPSRVIIQIENEQEMADFRRFSDAGAFRGTPLDIVIIGKLEEQPSRNAGYDCVAHELHSRGVELTWCETYLQDGRDPIEMIKNQAEPWWGYPRELPVIECTAESGIGPNNYNLTPWLPNREYSVYRWEQLDKSWLSQMP